MKLCDATATAVGVGVAESTIPKLLSVTDVRVSQVQSPLGRGRTPTEARALMSAHAPRRAVISLLGRRLPMGASS